VTSFRNLVVIRESEIATQLKTSFADVSQKLQQLMALGVIAYEPQTDKPRITLLTPRMREEDVRITKEVYDVRKQGDEERWHAMEKYLRRDVCRSVQLLRYFGDEFPQPCGHCDVCRAEKKLKATSAAMQSLDEELLRVVLTAPVTIEEAVHALKAFDAASVIEFIRRKLDAQELVLDERSKLRIIH
jgi:ATP-dependent DNA helicase RecQ